ncbi:MAG TPA: hypothetical protein VMW72_14610 [Sedimentisphaerales bacterium]|nr:hypothetical protein [Sedimentisphaerales bacterium]
MFEIKVKGKRRTFLFFTFYFSLVFSAAALQSKTEAAVSSALEGIWDPAKYISLDEIKPGMEAYCLTEYGVAGIEKFGLEVVDVVRDFEPGLDVILVSGTDERFIHTGPVAGCSGSPVYINGRLAGALAYAWPYAKDPLYGVTPIAEMLKVGLGGQVSSSGQSSGQGWSVFDFSKPIDLTEVDRQFRNELKKRSRNLSGVSPLPCLLITSGLTSGIREQLDELFKPFGMMVVAGGGSGSNTDVSAEKVQLIPGACLIVPLVSGDINLAVSGTVTEIRGDKVYGFGHSYLGYGPVDLPMATGKVHTVVSNIYRSFKLTSVLEDVGALTMDESMAVFGRIGAKAKTIPLTIRIDRYNDIEKRVYNCRVANNRLLTPLLLQSAVAGAAFQLGDFPPDHMVEYKVAIDLEDAESINFENVSTSRGLIELIMESVGSVALLMNNPYKEVGINSIDYDIRIVPRNIISHIWSLDLSNSKVKAGENIKIGVVVESVLAGKKKYQCTLEIPEDLAPGRYDLTVCGSPDYERFLLKAVPYKFIAQSVPDLIEALNYSLGIGRDKLYFLLDLPPGGVALEQAELPDLPATKVLVLQNAKRTLKIQPFSHWIERSLETGTVVIDKKVIKITVEKR